MTGISYLRLASIARADGWDVLETPASIWFERSVNSGGMICPESTSRTCKAGCQA